MSIRDDIQRLQGEMAMALEVVKRVTVRLEALAVAAGEDDAPHQPKMVPLSEWHLIHAYPSSPGAFRELINRSERARACCTRPGGRWMVNEQKFLNFLADQDHAPGKVATAEASKRGRPRRQA